MLDQVVGLAAGDRDASSATCTYRAEVIRAASVQGSGGAGVPLKDEDGFTALMYAANQGHDRVVRALLAAGAAIDHRDKQGSTALMHAAQHGHLAVVAALLRAGADVRAQQEDALTAREIALRNGRGPTASLPESAETRVSI